MPKLKTEGEGKPKLNVVDVPAYDLLMDADMSDWPEAGLKDTIRYLYAHKSLKLPAEWKKAIPKSL